MVAMSISRNGENGRAEQRVVEIKDLSRRFGNKAALDQILGEWTSNRDYNERRQRLSSGIDGLAQLNSTTIFDDGAVDSLGGGADLDWFLSSALQDRLIDRILQEFVN